MIGPIARPGARGLGPGLGLTYYTVLRAGPGLDILVADRAGPGPHNSICGPGPGRVFTTAAGPGRAWASNHICGPGLGLDFRPVQDTSVDTVFGVRGGAVVLGNYDDGGNDDDYKYFTSYYPLFNNL